MVGTSSSPPSRGMASPGRHWPRLVELYAAFSSRDVETVLAAMAADVEWPDAGRGGRLVGRDAVREHWARQPSDIRLILTPLRFRERDDGRTEVTVRQVARDAGGTVLAREEVRHVYEFHEDLVRRMVIE